MKFAPCCLTEQATELSALSAALCSSFNETSSACSDETAAIIALMLHSPFLQALQ